MGYSADQMTSRLDDGGFAIKFRNDRGESNWVTINNTTTQQRLRQVLLEHDRIEQLRSVVPGFMYTVHFGIKAISPEDARLKARVLVQSATAVRSPEYADDRIFVDGDSWEEWGEAQPESEDDQGWHLYHCQVLAESTGHGYQIARRMRIKAQDRDDLMVPMRFPEYQMGTKVSLSYRDEWSKELWSDKDGWNRPNLADDSVNNGLPTIPTLPTDPQ